MASNLDEMTNNQPGDEEYLNPYFNPDNAGVDMSILVNPPMHDIINQPNPTTPSSYPDISMPSQRNRLADIAELIANTNIPNTNIVDINKGSKAGPIFAPATDLGGQLRSLAQNYMMGQQMKKKGQFVQSVHDIMGTGDTKEDKINKLLQLKVANNGEDYGLGIDNIAKQYDAMNKTDILNKHLEDVLALAQSKSNGLNIGLKTSQQQDKLEEQTKKNMISARGNASLVRTETQRDAAATAYIRILEIENKGQVLNPIDYIDILGQIYKARTGAAPTEEILKTAVQDTLKGSFSKWYTYFTGKQTPATTKDIMASLKDMSYSMGNRADIQHDGYMAQILTKPKGLDQERWDNLVKDKSVRGFSFKDQVGQFAKQGGMVGGMTLDKAKALEFFFMAGGDREKARSLVRQAGYQL